MIRAKADIRADEYLRSVTEGATVDERFMVGAKACRRLVWRLLASNIVGTVRNVRGTEPWRAT